MIFLYNTRGNVSFKVYQIGQLPFVIVLIVIVLIVIVLRTFMPYL
ncbi:MAG TPA: hypothetical protein VNG51_17125 [Ktedonobacteraceae bacterium]|nr:hypothetical protein [Ktedonobacteraceae bacterium]